MRKHTSGIGAMILNFGGVTLLAVAMTLFYRRILHVNQTTVAMSFLVLILIVASRLRLTYSVYLSIVCALLYNFFFLPPIGTLTIADPQNWIALAAFLCTSFLVSHLSNNEHIQSEISERRRQEVERLYIFSQELLLHDDPRTLARISPSIAATVFGFRAVALYVRDTDTIYSSDSQLELLSDVEMRKAAHVSEAGVSVVDGVSVMPLMLGMRSMGSLAFRDGDDAGSRLEAIGTLIAIALERAAALERSSHMEAARESERLRSALLDSITHDLRTPLTSIRAAATTLMSQPQLADAERREMYSIVDEESARLNKLIGQAVEMAQLDSESIQVKPRSENIRELIALALEEARPLLGERVEEIDVAKDLPPVSIDRVLVRRVLRHLIENAAKYSPPGSPLRIYGRIEGYRLLVSVEDQGRGIDAAEQPFIFDKFFRGKNQQTGTSGTGMGLAIVKAIMAAHGGGIEVVSQPGRGSTFTFWLPVAAE
jgi:two-component system, OmpR family, sensor histidine kinase KdpD